MSTTHLDRRALLRTAGALAVGTAGLAAGCSRMSGNSAQGQQTIKWAQYITPQSGTAADANKKWVKAVVAAFEQENPEWTVKLEGYEWDKIDQRLILDMRAGVTHDVSLTTPQLMAQHAEAGSLADLSSRVTNWKQSERDDFDWNPVWKSCIVGGKQLAIPLGVDARLLLHRRSMFDEARLDAGGPASLQQLVTQTKKLTDDKTWGLGMFLGSDRATTELSFAPLVWSFGGDIYDTAAHRATLSAAPAVKAARWIYDAVHKEKVIPPFAYAPTASNDDILLNDFLAGKTASSFSFGNYWISALEAKGFVQDCFPAKADCSPKQAQAGLLPTADHAAFTNTWTVSIASSSKHPDMAWKLIEVMLRPDLMVQYADAGLPGRLSEYSKPEYQSAFYKTWLDAAKKGRAMPATAHYQELADSIAAAVQELLGGRASDVASVLSKYEGTWNSKYGG